MKRSKKRQLSLKPSYRPNKLNNKNNLIFKLNVKPQKHASQITMNFKPSVRLQKPCKQLTLNLIIRIELFKNAQKIFMNTRRSVLFQKRYKKNSLSLAQSMRLQKLKIKGWRPCLEPGIRPNFLNQQKSRKLILQRDKRKLKGVLTCWRRHLAMQFVQAQQQVVATSSSQFKGLKRNRKSGPNPFTKSQSKLSSNQLLLVLTQSYQKQF